MNKIIVLFLIVSSLFFSVEIAEGAREIEAKIVAVNGQGGTLLLQEKGGIGEYKVGLNPKISLNGSPVSLEALSPIISSLFQEAIIKVNYEGEVYSIESYYNVLEVKVEEISNEEISLKDINGGETKSYKVNQDVDILYNNNPIDLEEVKEGYKGAIILGIEGRLNSLLLHSYKVRGFLEEANQNKGEITLNVGDRFNPQFKKVKVASNSYIFDSQRGEIELGDITQGSWVRLEIYEGRKSFLVREI